MDADFRKWKRHREFYNHELSEDASEAEVSPDSSLVGDIIEEGGVIEGRNGDKAAEEVEEDELNVDIATDGDDRRGDEGVGGGGSDSSGSDAGFSDPGNLGEWHPFENKVHAQLVLLFLGSHRRNFDLVTFRAFLTILKVKSFTKKISF